MKIETYKVIPMGRKASKSPVTRFKVKSRTRQHPPTKQKLKKANKQKSITQFMKQCDAAFSLKVRMIGAWEKDGEMWNRCFTSGYEAPIRKLHCGHYLSRFYKAARWDFDNARAQSPMDNMWKRGDPIVFRQNLVKEIGIQRVEAVEAKRNVSIKLTREFLTAKLAELATSQ